MTTKLFVYGTLVGTRHNATKATLKNASKHTDGGYPTIVPDQGSKVEGEILEVNESELQRLDRYESEGQLYHRIPITDNGTVQAYIGDTDMLQTDAELNCDFNKPQLSNAFEQTTLQVHT